MKILKTIGLIILVLLIVIVVVGFFLPRNVSVSRSIKINASQEAAYAQANNLKNWEKWSPWHSIDPEMKITYSSEKPEGEGAWYSWESKHKDVGSGKYTNTKNYPYDSIISTMDFMENGTGQAKFTFKKEVDGTIVTWSMHSDMGNNPIGRVFGLFMDKLIGKDFEKGLAAMKTQAEANPVSTVSHELKIEETTIEEQNVLTVLDSCSLQEISQKLGTSYQAIMEFAGQQNLNITGQPFAIYHSFSMEKVVLEPGLPVDKQIESKGRVMSKKINAGKVILAHHYGPYEQTEIAHAKVDEYITAHNLTVTGAPWEVYVTDPGVEKDSSKWYTKIFYPVQ